VFVVNSASPIRTLANLFDAARAKPGELSMASVGPGTTFQMGFGTFTRAANVNMIFVPFPGSAPAVNAVLGQHVTSAFSGYAVVSEHIKAGTLRALAVTTARRSEALPNTWLHRPATRREDFPCQLGAVHTWHIATNPKAKNLRSVD
jgi:tripartite-type tricarboxylate transporter receptor subunit TctC